jgi:type IX secretion system PorP/SprF family membrane protein
MMRKNILAFFLCVSLFGAKAQQLHFMSQYLQHNSMLNPAAAGITGKSMVGVSYRNQWSSFPGNPITTMVYTDISLKKLKAGIAGYIYKDQTGPTSRTGVQLAYSYHIISRDERQKFAMGIELRGFQYAIDRSKLTEALGNDPVLGGADSKFGFDAGFGVYYTKDDKLSLGVAVSQMIQNKLQLNYVPNADISGRLYRHFNFMANYKYDTGDDIVLVPNALLRVMQNAPSEFELGMKLDYQEILWVAVIAKFRQLYSLQFGFKLKDRVNVAYSYDAFKSPATQFDGGSGAHEIGLRFDFGKKASTFVKE